MAYVAKRTSQLQHWGIAAFCPTNHPPQGCSGSRVDVLYCELTLHPEGDRHAPDSIPTIRASEQHQKTINKKPESKVGKTLTKETELSVKVWLHLRILLGMDWSEYQEVRKFQKVNKGA